MATCAMRRSKSCGWIDVALGFTVGVSDDVCRECTRRGRYTLEGSRYRQGIVDLTVRGVKRDGTRMPHVARAMERRGHRVELKKMGGVHWPFPRWESWVNEWDGNPWPRAVAQGVWQPTAKAWKDLRAKWGGKDCGCGGCGCWRPAKRVVLFVMDMVRPLQRGRRVG